MSEFEEQTGTEGPHITGQVVESMPASDFKPEGQLQTEDAHAQESTEWIGRALESWFDEHIRNSPVSRATEAYNHLVAKLGDLEKRLELSLYDRKI